jgi:ATP-GRASP peptide maturase of grasp-with-spasm system
MIIIFSIKNDMSTTSVIKWLNFYGQKVVRINSDDSFHKFHSITNEGIFYVNSITNEIINLYDAKACWWRRSGLSINQFVNKLPKESYNVNEFDLTKLVNGNRNMINNESKDLIEFIYYSVYKKCKINLGKPIFNLNRLIVMELASEIGFKIPQYKIVTQTNQIDRNNKTVTKAIANGIYEIINNKRFYTYTELLEEEDFDSIENINFFPSLVVNYIEKKIELRVFYIESEFFAMAIFSQGSNQTLIDFRKYNHQKPNRNEPFKLPVEIVDKLKKMFKRLKLNCGSVDLIIDHNDEYWFLEINPVGQYGMVSNPCNYNLDKLIANYLIYGEVRVH